MHTSLGSLASGSHTSSVRNFWLSSSTGLQHSSKRTLEWENCLQRQCKQQHKQEAIWVAVEKLVKDITCSYCCNTYYQDQLSGKFVWSPVTTRCSTLAWAHLRFRLAISAVVSSVMLDFEQFLYLYCHLSTYIVIFGNNSYFCKISAEAFVIMPTPTRYSLVRPPDCRMVKHEKPHCTLASLLVWPQPHTKQYPEIHSSKLQNRSCIHMPVNCQQSFSLSVFCKVQCTIIALVIVRQAWKQSRTRKRKSILE